MKNIIVEIKKDNKLKGNLKNKNWKNTFVNIKKLSKITHKINKIKVVQNTIKNK